ncbi:hypothetical protein X566_05620 [Afipia sp. P52-10]|nr:hypothetical protein X566_05620 [Afipia sp. P52-10]
MRGKVKPMMLRSLTLVSVSLLCVGMALARDDGRYAGTNPELKKWFDSLASGRGPCCSDADGFAVSDVDWESKDGHYRVRLDGQWLDIPDDAVITAPNRVGRTMVWPIKYPDVIVIRCFMPGAMI